MIKTVLFAGNFDKNYNRTQIISIGLEDLGIEVIYLFFKKHNQKSKVLIQELSSKADFIFLPAFTHKDVRFVKKNTNKPVIFDPLISRYLTKVFDFKQINRYSPRAYKNYLKDKIAFKYADKIIADTQEHKKYYHQKFNISNKKIEVLEIGVDRSVFYPTSKKLSQQFIVGFYGGFIPLQGVQYIVEAAKILSSDTDIVFKLVGNGFEYENIQNKIIKEKIKNIELIGWVDYNELPQFINNFDVCLGIFGETPKTDKVIPNKIFHYAACEKLIVSKDTKAINELFTHRQNIILSSSNPYEIAESIKWVKNNPHEVLQIAKQGYNLISSFDTKAIASRFIKIAQDCLM